MLLIEEDHSEHSTVDVESVTAAQSLSVSCHSASTHYSVATSRRHGGASTLRRKRVRFNERHNQSYDDTVRFQDQCIKTWYTEKQFEQFRADRREQVCKARGQFMAANAQQKEDDDYLSFCKTLECMYRTSSNVDYVLSDARQLPGGARKLESFTNLYTNNNGDDGDDNNNNNSVNTSFLEHYTGLEVLLLPQIRLDITRRQTAAAQTVWEIQDEQEKGLWDDNPHEMDDELRDSSCNFSQACALFAQLIALAQWHATCRLLLLEQQQQEQPDDDEQQPCLYVPTEQYWMRT